MPYVKPPVTKKTDKFIGYCAVTPNKKFMKLFKRADVKNVLISYHYIRKDPKFTQEILKMVRDRGGLFMTDSGAFSFLNDPNFDASRFDWIGYLVEYVEWLKKNKEYVFSACNLDVDLFVGHELVQGWNAKFFEPLEKDMNIIYVAHPNVLGKGELDCFKEYCEKYNYVAVNERFARQVSAIYQTAKTTKTQIHGLAWTKPTLLKDFPFFSVDSSSWVNYQKYGATPVWDGRNFSQYDKDNKSIRATLRTQCEKYGVSEYEFINEKNPADDSHNDDEGLTFSLRTWIDVFEDIKRYARTKLSTSLSTMLIGKRVVFNEDTSGATQPQIKQRATMDLDNMVQKSLGEELEITEALPTTYAVDEDGTEVAIYVKRSEKIAIDKFNEDTGGTMVCDSCHISDKCPKFKPNNTCAFDFSPLNMRETPMAVMDMLIATQTERVNRAMMIERMEGGMPNKVFAMELKLLSDLNDKKINMMLLAQNKGLRITQTTVEYGGMETEKEKPRGGFSDMLKTLMAK